MFPRFAKKPTLAHEVARKTIGKASEEMPEKAMMKKKKKKSMLMSEMMRGS